MCQRSQRLISMKNTTFGFSSVCEPIAIFQTDPNHLIRLLISVFGVVVDIGERYPAAHHAVDPGCVDQDDG